jgi:hypothetical protein
MRVTEDRLEKDAPGAPRRKTVGLELAKESDAKDDNGAVAASSGLLILHGAHQAGWMPFVEGGDYYVTITKAPPVEVPEPKEDAEPEAPAA